MFIYVCGMSVHMYVSVHGSQKTASMSWSLLAQVVVSHLTWVLITKFRSPVRAASVINC